MIKTLQVTTESVLYTFFNFKPNFKSIYFCFLYSCDYCRFILKQIVVSTITSILLFNNKTRPGQQPL